MKVNLLYFAAARESAGTQAEQLDLPAGATAADALAAACARHPRLSAIARQLRLAVDQSFADGSLPLRDGAEVALIPPVAGGAGERAGGTLDEPAGENLGERSLRGPPLARGRR